MVKRVVNILCIVLAVLSIIATAVFGVLLSGENAVEEGAAQLVDSQTLYLMQRASDVDIVKTIFEVYNEETYQKAKNNNRFSDEVKEQFFGSAHYTGNYDSKPEVSLSTPRYNPSASALVAKYYVPVTITYGNNVKTYNLIVEFVEDKLITVNIIP